VNWDVIGSGMDGVLVCLGGRGVSEQEIFQSQGKLEAGSGGDARTPACQRFHAPLSFLSTELSVSTALTCLIPFISSLSLSKNT